MRQKEWACEDDNDLVPDRRRLRFYRLGRQRIEASDTDILYTVYRQY